MKKLMLLSIIVIYFFNACKTVLPGNNKSIKSITGLKLLDVYDIPYNYSFKQTTVGGLSGIDYDVKNNLYYFICDDRSSINPARFYTASIQLNNQKIDTVIFNDAIFLKNQNNQLYPSFKEAPLQTPDPEAMRYNAKKNWLVWSSEGERIVNAKDTILVNPSITIVNRQGTWIDSFPLPANLFMHATEKGPRQNGVLEAMGFGPNYKTLMLSVEEPLYEDGPKAELIPNKAYVRFFEFNVAAKKNTGQFAYELDPVAYSPTPFTAFKVNGIPDILSIGHQQWLVIERSFSTGRLPCTIKIFIADFSKASNINDVASLKNNGGFVPAQKKLLLNMDDLGVFTDNIEGVTIGPILPNGHASLLLIADNNFNAFQKSQLFLLEIIP